MKKGLLPLFFVFFLLFSCSEPDSSNKETEIISSLDLIVKKDGALIALSFQSKEYFQCPSELSVNSFSENRNEIRIEISDEIYFPATPCFAIYDPQLASTIIQISNSEVEKTKDLIVIFGKKIITGQVKLGAEPEIIVDDNCCLEVILE